MLAHFATFLFATLLLCPGTLASDPLTPLFDGQKKYNVFLETIDRPKSHPRHNPRFLHHNKPTKTVGLVIPGSFESPAHFQTMSQYFYKNKELNTFVASLPGFWERDLKDVRHVHFSEWVEYLERTMDFLLSLSNQVVIYGHSLGGLAGIYLASRYPENVKVLVLSSPAVNTSSAIKFVSFFDKYLTAMGLTINGRLPKANGYDVPLQSGNIARQIKNFSTYGKIWPIHPAFIKHYQTPTFIVAPQNDKVVSTKAMKKLFSQVRAPTQIQILPKTKGLTHRSLIKSENDLCLNIKEKCWESLDLKKILQDVDLFFQTHHP